MWQGISLYYASDFSGAAGYFALEDGADALFNEGNALAMGRDYAAAVARYDRLLADKPTYPGAAGNRQRVLALMDAIRQMSEQQQEESGVSGESVTPEAESELEDLAAEQTVAGDREQLSAEDVLQDPAVTEMWLRAVEHDPGEFLASKFRAQLQAREAEQSREQKP
jgi:Ca-activated chloride channel family protein